MVAMGDAYIDVSMSNAQSLGCITILELQDVIVQGLLLLHDVQSSILRWSQFLPLLQDFQS